MIATSAYDSGDLDALEDLKRSAGYKLTRDRILAELDRKREYLESPANPENTQFARGYVAALRVVLGLPELLHHEIDRELKQEQKR